MFCKKTPKLRKLKNVCSTNGQIAPISGYASIGKKLPLLEQSGPYNYLSLDYNLVLELCTPEEWWGHLIRGVIEPRLLDIVYFNKHPKAIPSNNFESRPRHKSSEERRWHYLNGSNNFGNEFLRTRWGFFSPYTWLYTILDDRKLGLNPVHTGSPWLSSSKIVAGSLHRSEYHRYHQYARHTSLTDSQVPPGFPTSITIIIYWSWAADLSAAF